MVRQVTVVPEASSTVEPTTDSVIDQDSHAHRDYAVDGDTLVIVRPDGHITLRATDADRTRVMNHLDRLRPRHPAERS